MGYKGCKEFFFHEETSLAQLQTAHALFKVRQYSFLMPENQIHPGCNSTNTNKLLLENNLVQSALKSCLIYTYFRLALKPSVPLLPPGPGAPAPAPSAEHRGRRLNFLSQTFFLKAPVLQRMWHKPGYDNSVTHPAVMCVPSFGQAFSEITLPSRNPNFFLIKRWQLLQRSIWHSFALPHVQGCISLKQK